MKLESHSQSSAGIAQLIRFICVASVITATAILATAPILAQDVEQGVKGVGTNDRNWITESLPDPTSSERFSFSMERGIKVTMRDGVTLDGRIFLPDLPTGEVAPCILVADAYGISPGDPYERRSSALAERGFAVANFSFRGVGGSEGERGLHNDHGRDGYDLIAWMRDQEWCNGKIGMYGASLRRGSNQWLVAREAPPGLKAIAPDVGCGDCYNYLWYPGGMLPGPGRERGHSQTEWEQALQHRDYDEWWQDRTTSKEHHRAIAEQGIAALVVSGLKDYVAAGNVQAFEDFSLAGGDGVIIIHPEGHYAAPDVVMEPYSYDIQLVRFFDRHLRGENHGVVDPGKAVIYVRGAEQWRWEETWPIADTRWETLYLRSEGSGSIGSLNDGTLRVTPPEEDEGSASYRYDPNDGPFLRTLRGLGEPGITELDQTPFESEVLTWTSGALEAPLEVTGKVLLEFWAAATADDADFVVQVSDVAVDGTSTQVTSGYLNAPRSESNSKPHLLTPGEIRQYTVDTQPTAYVFPAGHRIRLALAGGTEAPEDIGESPQGPGKNPNPVSVTLYHNAAYPATVRIPVIGTAVFPSTP